MSKPMKHPREDHLWDATSSIQLSPFQSLGTSLPAVNNAIWLEFSNKNLGVGSLEYLDLQLGSLQYFGYQTLRC